LIQIQPAGRSSKSTHRRPVEQQPVEPKVSDGNNELVKFHRFNDIAVHTQAVTFDDILFLIRGGENDDRDDLGARITFRRPQDFQPVDFRQF